MASNAILRAAMVTVGTDALITRFFRENPGSSKAVVFLYQVQLSAYRYRWIFNHWRNIVRSGPSIADEWQRRRS